LRKNAEYLFGNEQYELASGLFRELMILEPGSQDLVEKVAFCEQKKGDFASALKYYKQAELFDANRLWNLRKMIFCSRKLGDNDEALKWCCEAELLSPDDVYVQTMTGNIFLEKKMYEEALQHYLKADFLTENDDKLNRAISWVYFMQDKYESALGYIEKIDSGNLTVSDQVHKGHCFLLLKNYSKVLETYAAVSKDALLEILNSEKEILFSKGVEEQYFQWLKEYFSN
jgi:tetratricopeptide (TPR) repeat protein